MPTPVRATRARAGAVALGVAGVGFGIYPVLRPYPDSAAAFAAPTWVVAHLAAVVGFVLLVVATGAVWAVAEGAAAERLAFRAMLVTGAGVGLTLPYYGAEVFGLHAVGEWSLDRGDDAVLAIADGFRYGPAAATTFALGLGLLAVGGVLVALAVRGSGRLAGVPLALGLLLFIPQFFASPALRMAHGGLMLVGCLVLAGSVWTAAGRPRG